MAKLVDIEGTTADIGQLDDWGKETATVNGGPHDGHSVTIDTSKHNCGAYALSVTCSCGAYWQNAMNGCWQQGHQRREEGNPELKALMA